MDSDSRRRPESGPPVRRAWFAPGALALASLLLLAASLVPWRSGEWVYVLVTPLFPLLLIWLAVRRRRRVPRSLRVLLVALATVLVLSAVGIRWFDGQVHPPWLLGVPLSAVLMGLGLVLLPLLLVGFGFAATSDREPPPGNRERADPGGER